MQVTNYYPSGGKAEQWDDVAGYTTWNASGTVTAQRALTAQETAELAASGTAMTTANNQSTLQQRAAGALTANTTFLGIASPTNAQVVAQVQALTKECTALIRLMLGQLDTTSGT